MYLMGEEYKAWGGTETGAAFIPLEFTARKYVDYYTQGRVKDDVTHYGSVDNLPYSDELKMLIYELILLQQKHREQVSSTSNNGISVSYKTMDSKEYKAEVFGLVKAYLSNFADHKSTPLLWVGV